MKMWSEMKGRVYIIATLALINILIMKYQESRKGNKAHAWAAIQEEKNTMDRTDSNMLSAPYR